MIEGTKTCHLLNFVALGFVYLGNPNSAYFDSSIINRNFTWRLNKIVSFSTTVRPTLSFISQTTETNGQSTHLFYSRSGFRISGNVNIGDYSSDNNTSSTEFHFQNMYITGNLQLRLILWVQHQCICMEYE